MKKNILLILPWLPWPLNSGGNQAMFNSIKAIKDIANVIVVYTEGRKDRHKNERQQLQNILQNVTIIPCVFNSLRYKGFSLIDLLCTKIGRFFIKDKYKWICRNALYRFLPKEEDRIIFVNQIIKKYSIDIVQCEMISELSWCVSLPSKVRTIFVHHEIGFVKNELIFRGVERSSYVESCLNIAKINEISLLNQFDSVVTLSKIDSNKLKTEGVRTRIFSSFAVVDTNVNNENDYKFNNTLSFVGPESHLPNLDGIKWFLTNCWTKILERRNNYKLNIIGNWSKETITAIQKKYKNITFLGFVPDLHSAIKHTTMIVPIKIGSGIRMKILEAASCGVPIVTTSIGIEGIPFIDDIHSYIADDPNDYIEKILLLENNLKRNIIIENAKHLVKNDFSLEALTNNRLNIYNQILL